MRILTVLLSCLAYLSCHQQTDDISTHVYPTGTGYGYSISIKGKTAIKQASIPGLPGDKVFCDSTDAARVGRLVQSKISKRQNPAVSPREIDSLKIKTGC